MCENDEFNLDERILCSDDTCIGLVGNDGKCKECGAPYDGPLEVLGGASELDVAASQVSHDDDTPGAAAPTGAAPPDPPPAPGTEDDSEIRIPCADDLCVGVVGPDGRCGMCGRLHDIP